MGLPALRHDSFAGPSALQTTDALFQASVTITAPDGKRRRVNIRQDSRVWVD